MTNYPAANLSFRIYENGSNEIGTAKLKLPDISYMVVQLNGSGLMGTIDVPLMGMIENMEMGMDFLSVTSPDNFAMMMEPRKHLLDVRVAEEHWDIEDAEIGLWNVKHIFIARPKVLTPGDIAPATASNATGTFTVYRWEAYRDGQELWCIDKRNMVCRINGTDYMTDVRKALGYS